MKTKTSHEMRAAGMSYDQIARYRRKVDKAISVEASNMLAVLESLLEGVDVTPAAREIVNRIQATIDKAG